MVLYSKSLIAKQDEIVPLKSQALDGVADAQKKWNGWHLVFVLAFQVGRFLPRCVLHIMYRALVEVCKFSQSLQRARSCDTCLLHSLPTCFPSSGKTKVQILFNQKVPKF